MVDCTGLEKIEHIIRNFDGRTTLINGILVDRNICFGDGLLNSIVILINGVETIQVAPKLNV